MTVKNVIALGLITAFVSMSAMAADDVNNGAVKYKQNCAICHGSKGYGDGPTASALPHKPANIAKKLNKPFSMRFALVNDVLEGDIEKGMPAWKDILTKQDAYDILAYIDSINQ